jgi:predicted nucleic acid-binding protein
MRLVDANILVYAFTTSFPQHERARAWLDGKLNDGVPLGLPGRACSRLSASRATNGFLTGL